MNAAARALALASLATAAMLVASEVSGASRTWQVSTGDWSTASNWGGTLPTASDAAYIVNGGAASITQLGATCGTLSLGTTAGGGTVQMTDGTLLTGSNEYVGYSGAGTFTQSGGTNTISGSLVLGQSASATGTYNLNGGLLSLSGLTQGAGSATFNFSGGTFQAKSTFSTSVPIVLNTPGSNGVFDTNGKTLTLSGALTGSGGLQKTGSGTLSLSASNTYSGDTTVSAGTLQILGGQLPAAYEYVGTSGAASLVQSGGVNAVANNLYLGYYGGASGTYALNDGQLSAVRVVVGYEGGAGKFTQSGGTNTVVAEMVTGWGPGATGTYNLSSTGLLSVSSESVGYWGGSGSFVQSGGTHVVFDLRMGNGPAGSGSYNLTSGVLSGTTEYVGINAADQSYNAGILATATFTQGGGTNAVSGTLYVGNSPYSVGSSTFPCQGMYGLNGGLLSAGAECIGYGLSGSGNFTQSGGTHSVSTLVLAQNAGSTGTYNLNGGLLCLSALTQGGGSAAFNFSAGTFQAASTFSTSMPIVLSTGGSNGVFDTNGNVLTLSGPLSGPGGLQKVGSGTLTLAASNGYTGTTLVSSGTLLLADANAIGGSTFNTGGTGLISFGTLGSAVFGGLQGSGNLTLNNATPAGVSLSVGNNDVSTTFSGHLSGSGSLAKVGAGVLTLAASNSYTGATSINAGTLSLTHSAALAGGGSITFGGGTLQFSANNKLDYSNRILGSTVPIQIDTNGQSVTFSGNLSSSNSAGLNKIGSGKLTLAAANDYTGTTLVSSGTLLLANTGAMAGSTLDTSGTGSLSFGALTSATFGGLQGSGNLALGNTAAAAVSLSVGGNDASTTFSGGLSGSGSLTKLGSGTLTLSASTSYTGTTLISAGTLLLANAGAISRSTLDTSGAGALSFGALTSATFGGLQGSGNLALGNGSAAAVSLSVGGNNASTTFFGALSGNGSLTKLGSGTFTVNGQNNYGGSTTVSAGTLQILGGQLSSATAYVGTSGSASVVQSGGTFSIPKNHDLYLGYNAGDSGTYNLSGGSVSAPGETIGAFGSGSFTQSGGTNSVEIMLLGGGSGSSGTYSLSGGSVSAAGETIGSYGSGSFTQLGGTNSVSGSLYLGFATNVSSTGNGTYSLSGSGLLSAYNECIGNSGSGSFTQSGGTNSVTGTLVLAQDPGSVGTYNLNGGLLSVSGLSQGGGSAAFNFGGGTLQATLSFSIGTPIVLSAAGSNGVFDTNGNTLTLDGGLSGPGGLQKTGSGALILSASGSHTGATLVSGGTLLLADPGAISRSTLDTSGAGSLSFGALTSATFGGLQGSGDLTLSNTAAAAVSLSVGGNGASTTFSGDLSGGGSLTKTGSGKLTLAAANDYTGTTLVSSGTLLLANTDALAGSTFDTSGTGSLSFGSLTSATFGGLQGSRNLAISNTAVGAIALSVGGNATDTTFTGVLSGSGSLTKLGTGTLTLTGSNSYSGNTTVSAGVLQLLSGKLAGANDYVENGALVQLGGTNTVSGSVVLAQSGSSTAAYTLNDGLLILSGLTQGAGAATFNVGGGTLRASGTFSTSVPIVLTTDGSNGVFDTNGKRLTIAGGISGPGGLQKVGAGALVLSASDSYTGTTLVSSGTLLLVDPNALSGSTFDTSGTGVLSFGALTGATFGGLQGTRNLALSNTAAAAVALSVGGNNDSTTFAGIISGSGSLTKLGSGTLTLTASNSYSDTTTISGGALQIGNGGSGANLASQTIMNNAALVFNHGDDLAYTGAISGSGNLVKSGSGTLTLAATNGYTGTTLVSGGTLLLGDPNSIGGSTFDASGSGSLSFGALTSATFGGLQGSGGLMLSNTAAAAVSLIVGGNGTDTTFSGALSGTGTLIKVGAGTFTVTGLNTYSGDTSVGAGTLQILGGQLPAATEYVGGSGTASVAHSGGINAVSSSLYIGRYNSGTYTLSGSGLLSSPSEYISVTYYGVGGYWNGHYNVYYPITYRGNGSFTQSGGTNSVSTLYVGHDGGGTYQLSGNGLLSSQVEYVGYGGSGSFTQSGGTNAVSGTLYLNGVYTLSDTGVLSAPAVYVGTTYYEYFFNGSYGYWYTYVEPAAGTFAQSGGTHLAGNLYLGNYGSGTYNLSDSGLLSATNERLGCGGAGTFTQSGGTNVISGSLILGQNSGYTGTYNLNGGLLTLSGLARGAGNCAFNVTGGTLQATATFSSSVDLTINATGGSLTVDTNGNTLNLSGVIHSGTWIMPGGLRKVGAGTLILSNTIGYSGYGGTTLAGGSINFFATGPGGGPDYPSALCGPVCVDPGDGNTAWLIWGGGSNTTDLTGFLQGGLTLASGTTGFDLQGQTVTFGGQDGTAIAGSGGLSISNGTLAFGSYSGLGTGPVALVNNGSGTGFLCFNRGSGTHVVANTISGVGGLIQAGGDTLLLTGSNSYSGGTTILAGTLNISADAALGAVPGSPATSLTFAGNGTLQAAASFSLAANRTISIAGGATGTIDTQGYAVFIPGQISGPGGLAKTGSGTLTLSSSNTYPGPIEIQQGAIVLPNGLSMGGAAITIDAAGELRAANIVNRALTGSGTVTSTGPLVIGDMTSPAGFNFSGTLNVGGNRVLLLSAGTVQLGAATNLAAGGRLDSFYGARLGPASAADLAQTLAASGNATVVDDFINNGTVSGPTAPAWLTFDSAVTGLGVFQGNVRIFGTYTPGAGSIEVQSGNLSLAGGVQSSAGIDKTGPGTLTLSASNGYTGGTTVRTGTLRIAAADALPPGGDLSISSSGHVVLSGGLTHAIALGGLTITSGAGAFGAGLPTPPASGAWSGDRAPAPPVLSNQQLAISNQPATSPTPEPGTVLLLLAAAAAWAAGRKRSAS